MIFSTSFTSLLDMKKQCIHGNEKRGCKDCKGLSRCIHDKNRKRCKVCHGTDLCIHNKQRYFCRDCGGKAWCNHGKQKYHCKDCGGKAWCNHGIQKYHCKVCNAGKMCVHGKRKYYCRDCEGKAFCLHGRYKSLCRDCKSVSSENDFYKFLTNFSEMSEEELYQRFFHNQLIYNYNQQRTVNYCAIPITNFLSVGKIVEESLPPQSVSDNVCIHGCEKDCCGECFVSSLLK
jgi:hypothetical protein